MKARGRFTARAVAAVVLAAVALTACTHKANQPRTGGSQTNTGVSAPPIQVSATRTLAGNERLFGSSIGTVPGAVYQPDVIVIGGGADSIVGAQDNGFVWTVKGTAPGADKLAVGRIMVATSFATGRVGRVQPVGGDVQVVLTPVSLTDVFKTLHVGSSAPVTLQSPVAYAYDNSPLTSTDGDGGEDAAPAPADFRVRPVAAAGPIAAAGPVAIPSAIASQPPSVMLPAPTVTPKPVHEGKFDLMPFCCFPDQGVRISYHEPTGRMAAIVGIVMGGQPLVDFHIDIDFGGLQEVVFELHGPKAIEFKFDAATTDASGNYRSPTLRIPLAFTFPIAGIPLTVTLNQSVHASIQLAGQASFSSEGKYAIDGGLGFAYRNGSFSFDRPHFSSQISSLQQATSLSVGINALSIGYGLHFAIGIGVLGFNGGPFFDLDATLAIDKDGSPPQTSLTAGCATAAVAVTGSFGVGYTIPKFVAAAVNKFLSLLNSSPIATEGGKKWGPYKLWNPGSGKLCYNRTGG